MIIFLLRNLRMELIMLRNVLVMILLPGCQTVQGLGKDI